MTKTKINASRVTWECTKTNQDKLLASHVRPRRRQRQQGLRAATLIMVRLD